MTVIQKLFAAHHLLKAHLLNAASLELHAYLLAFDTVQHCTCSMYSVPRGVSSAQGDGIDPRPAAASSCVTESPRPAYHCCLRHACHFELVIMYDKEEHM